MLSAALPFGYLLGSVPFGLLLTRAAGLGDIRAVGSGNIGATNVLRTGRRGLAAATLLLDGGKAFAAAALAGHWWGGMAGPAAGLGAVLGHVFPVWLRFRGGKGVASGLGALLGFAPWAGAGACLGWLGLAAVTRRSSVAALGAFAAAPFLAWGLHGGAAGIAAGLVSALIWVRHRGNLARLRAGTEPRIGRAAPPLPSPPPPRP